MERFFEDYLERMTDFHNEFKGYLKDLPDDACNWVPGDEMNSVAVLVTHTMGSQSFWVGQMAAGIDAKRVRSTEFEAQVDTIAELIATLDAGLADVERWVGSLTLEDLNKMVLSPPHEREFSVLWSLFHALDHIALHAGHLGMTRQLYLRQ